MFAFVYRHFNLLLAVFSFLVSVLATILFREDRVAVVIGMLMMFGTLIFVSVTIGEEISPADKGTRWLLRIRKQIDLVIPFMFVLQTLIGIILVWSDLAASAGAIFAFLLSIGFLVYMFPRPSLLKPQPAFDASRYPFFFAATKKESMLGMEWGSHFSTRKILPEDILHAPSVDEKEKGHE